MRKIQVILLDDIDGSEAERTVQFALEGATYEIDLSQENITKLEQALEPFISKATKVATSRGGRSRGRGNGTGGGGGRSKAAEVRAWAKDQGIEVPDRGRVPNSVIEQYERAN